jgi:hypothetical protein
MTRWSATAQHPHASIFFCNETDGIRFIPAASGEVDWGFSEWLPRPDWDWRVDVEDAAALPFLFDEQYNSYI